MSEAEHDTTPRRASALDAVLVIIIALTMTGVLAGLFLLKPAQENLPIIASIASALMGLVIGGYAGFRWGASDSSKPSPTSGQRG